MVEESNERLRALVADVAAAYFSRAHVGVAEIPAVVGNIAASLLSVNGDLGASDGARHASNGATPAESRKLTAAQIRKSITPDALISFEDGKRYKTMKRHLSGRGLTPQAYREKWGLPRDYPMTAPSYSARRSAMAKSIGLGQLAAKARGRPKKAAAAKKAAPRMAAAKKAAPKKRAAKKGRSR